MVPSRGLSLLFVFLAVFPRLTPGIQDFLARHTLGDGETQLWVRFAGITAKETSYVYPQTGEGLRLREVSDGRHFLQLIYSGNSLMDCDESTAEGEEVERMSTEVEERSRNATGLPLHGRLPEGLDWLDVPRLRVACRDNHRTTRRRARQHQYAYAHPAARAKRGVKDWMMLPGTNWCGPSNRTRPGRVLGPFAEADRCCRRHDKCQMYIPAFSGKYNGYNSGPFTMSHCRCDSRFRTCLKMADTGPSNLVGKVFFNIVQPRCFVLKTEKVCVKHSWWGKCLRFQYKKHAVVKTNFGY